MTETMTETVAQDMSATRATSAMSQNATSSIAPPALTAHGVSVNIGKQRIVSDVDLELGVGEWLGIIGPNGAGKSTLFHALAGLIRFKGRLQAADGETPEATDIALVPQQPVIPEGMSVAEYVLLGRTAHLGWLGRESRKDREIAASVMDRLGLEMLADRALTHLSGGEIQRVIVARALVQETPILLLDEPTSALDLGHQSAVLELIDGLRHQDKFSVIAVMHDLTTAARFADRLALLDKGSLVSVGTPSEVLEAEVLSDVYGTALMVREIDGELVVLPKRRS